MRYAKFSQHQSGPHTSELTRAGAILFPLNLRRPFLPPAFSRVPARSLQLPLALECISIREAPKTTSAQKGRGKLYLSKILFAQRIYVVARKHKCREYIVKLNWRT